MTLFPTCLLWQTNVIFSKLFFPEIGGIIAAGEITAILPGQGEKLPDNVTKYFLDSLLNYMVSEVMSSVLSLLSFCLQKKKKTNLTEPPVMMISVQLNHLCIIYISVSAESWFQML